MHGKHHSCYNFMDSADCVTLGGIKLYVGYCCQVPIFCIQRGAHVSKIWLLSFYGYFFFHTYRKRFWIVHTYCKHFWNTIILEITLDITSFSSSFSIPFMFLTRFFINSLCGFCPISWLLLLYFEFFEEVLVWVSSCLLCIAISSSYFH